MTCPRCEEREVNPIDRPWSHEAWCNDCHARMWEAAVEAMDEA